jgi:long-chain fatty acid transport protein
MINRTAIMLAGLLSLTVNAGAAGFRLEGLDSAAVGMGNSFVAVADNASAVWYNPAAMTGLKGTNLSLGSVLIAFKAVHANTSGAVDRTKSMAHLVPHFYATRELSPAWWVGFGVNTPFGLSTEWRKNAATSFVATKSEIETVNYGLNGACMVSDKISAAAGLSYYTVKAELNSLASPTQEVKLAGSGSGLGYGTAVMYRYSGKWNFGVNYHSQVRVKLDGNMTIGSVTPIKTDLTLPDILQLGAAYRPGNEWLFSAEADYTNWTTYRQLVIKQSADNSLVNTDINNWKSVWTFHAGAEHRASEFWKFRAGAFYDYNPVKEARFSARIPDADRVAVTAGAGYTKGNITVDVSYMYLRFLERKIGDSLQDDAVGGTSLNGKYNSSAKFLGVTGGYRF